MVSVYILNTFHIHVKYPSNCTLIIYKLYLQANIYKKLQASFIF